MVDVVETSDVVDSVVEPTRIAGIRALTPEERTPTRALLIYNGLFTVSV